MKNHNLKKFLFLCVFSLFVFTLTAFIMPIKNAKAEETASQPPAVSAIDVDNARYIFNQPKTGMVTAWEITTGKKLWEKSLSTAYIDSAKLDGQTIKITSQNNGSFSISTKDPKNPSVTAAWLKSAIYPLIGLVLLIGALIIILKNRKWYIAQIKTKA